MSESRATLIADTKGYTDGMDRAEASLSRFLNSEKRVENQLAGLAKEMLNAQSAGDALASVMDRVENSLKTSLGIGVAVGVGMAMKNALENGAKQFSEGLDEINKGFAQRGPDAYGDSISTLNQKLVANASQMEAVAKKREQLDSMKGGFFDTVTLGSARRMDKDLEQVEATNLKVKEQIIDAIAAKERQQSQVISLRLADRDKEANLLALRLSYSEKIGEAEAAGQEQVVEALRERQKLEEQTIEKAEKKKQDQKRLTSLEGDLGVEQLRAQLESGPTEAARLSIANRMKIAQNRNALDSDNFSSAEQARIAERASLEERIRQKALDMRMAELKLEEEIASLTGTEEEREKRASTLRVEALKKLLSDEKDVVKQAETRVQLVQLESQLRQQEAAKARSFESLRSQGRILDVQDPANKVSDAQKRVDSQEEQFSELKRKMNDSQSMEERLSTINELKRLRNEVATPDLQSRLSYSVDSLTAIGGGGGASSALTSKNTEEERLRLEQEMRDYLRNISENATVLKTK